MPENEEPYNSYLGSLPAGSTMTDATLNLDLLIGAVTGAVLSGPGTANLTGNLGALSVTISAGGVTETVSGANLSAYDLFANGFGPALLAGTPLTLSFTDSDTVSGTVANIGGTSSSSTGSAWGGGFGAFSFFAAPTSTSVNLSDTRTISGSNLNNYLTLIYTSPNNPVVVPLTGDPGISQDDDAPEPVTMGLVGAGLGLIVYLRRKQLR